MAEKARVAVIGTGWWSTSVHIPGLVANPAAGLVALCDSDPEKLQAATAKYPVPSTYTDHRTLLEQESLDGVVIATNHATHYEVARDCLAHGLHIMIEKPMTLHAAQARDLVNLAQAHACEVIVGYPWHFTPHAFHVRAVLHSGVLGPIQFINCLYTSNILALLKGDDQQYHPALYVVHGPGKAYSQPSLTGGGEGQTQITHAAGLMFFVTGLRAGRVSAVMNNWGLALDLVDSMSVAFAGGAIGSVGGTGNAPPDGGKMNLLIYCERGWIEMEMLRGTATIHGPERIEDHLGPPENRAEVYPMFATAGNLVDVILGRAPNGSPGEVGWRTVEFLDAAYRSAHLNGQAVDSAELYA